MQLKIKYFLLIVYVLVSPVLKAQNLHLKIQGKDSTETAVLAAFGYQKRFTAYQNLSCAVDSLFFQVQKNGFLDAQTVPIKKVNDSLFVSKFLLGQKYHLLRINYSKLPIDVSVLKKIAVDFNSNYFSIPFSKIKSTLSFLNQQIANQGRPFSYLQLKNIRKDAHGNLIADLHSVSSKPRNIDEIIVKGYKKFPVSFLKHFIGIKIGQVFNKKVLEEKMQRLQNLSFASSIKLPEVQFTQDSTTIYLYLQKEKSNTFDGFLGFSNDQENNKLQLTGNIDMLLRNNLNYGESLYLHYRGSGDGQTSFKTELELPYLLQTPIGLNLGLEIFKKDSSYINTAQHAKITHQLSAQLNTFIGYRHTESNDLLDSTAVLAKRSIEDYTANYVTIGGQYVVYNEFSRLFPTKANFGLELGYGNRIYEGTPSKQYIITANASYIFQMNTHNSIYFNNTSSLLSSEDYLTNELFRFGGINSIRGFSENSITASLFTVTQTEYRYVLSPNLYLHSIIDHAYYENKLLGIQENLYSVGFGFGLKTDAGVFRISFANGKADGQNFEFSNTKIHLGLKSVF